MEALVPDQQALLSFTAIAVGLVFAARRCGLSWSSVVRTLVFALLGASSAFLPGKKETVYVLAQHAVSG